MRLRLLAANLSLIKRGVNVYRTRDGLGKRMDPPIVPLVIALNYRDYNTSMSCGGHLLCEREERFKFRIEEGTAELLFRAERGLTYELRDMYGSRVETFNETPWVHIESDEERMKMFRGLIEKHNKDGIYWRVEKLGDEGTYRLETLPLYDLKRMRKDSKVLANKILRSREL